MKSITFDGIDLMTKSELASEIISRPGKALVIVQEDDTGHFRCFHSFAKEGDEKYGDISGLLRALSRGFEDCDYCPGDDGTSERGR